MGFAACFSEKSWEKKPAQPRRIWHCSKLKCLSVFPWMADTGEQSKKLPPFPVPDCFPQSLDLGASLCCPLKYRHKVGLENMEQDGCLNTGSLDCCLCCSLSFEMANGSPGSSPVPITGISPGPQLSLSWCLPAACPDLPLLCLYQPQWA